MISFSSFIGLSCFLSRSSDSALWIFSYYRTMKDSVLSIFELNEKLLLPKNQIYKSIIYFFMAFLYSAAFYDPINFIYITGIVNSIFYLCILNMNFFIYKNTNQMLLQTLFFFLLARIVYLICNKYLISILFFCSDIILLQYPINKFRIGVLLNDKSYFNIEKILIEIFICLLWAIYSTSEKFFFFFFINILNIFVWICMLFGYQIVEGDIGPNNKIYHFIINVFFIKKKFKGKLETNII